MARKSTKREIDEDVYTPEEKPKKVSAVKAKKPSVFELSYPNQVVLIRNPLQSLLELRRKFTLILHPIGKKNYMYISIVYCFIPIVD